jgi:hypothetical protein
MTDSALRQARASFDRILRLNWTDRQMNVAQSEAKSAITAIDLALAAPVEQQADEPLWLWKNGDHFLAFRHLYPCFTPGGDPMTLGEPFGRAVLRHSHNREGRDEHANDLHARNAAQGCQLRPT